MKTGQRTGPGGGRMAIIVALLLAALPAQARLYQWVNPVTGTAQFSGDPPSWYRSGRDGPRVLVFDGGTLVDDTSLTVPPERSEALRQAAFEEVTKRRELQALKRLEEAAQRKAEAEDKAREKEAARTARAAAEVETGEPREAETGLGRDLDAATIERLKSIIAEFDRLGGGAGTGGPPPAPR